MKTLANLLLLTAITAPSYGVLHPPCSMPALQGEPFCDTKLSAEARAKALLAKMNIGEKIR